MSLSVCLTEAFLFWLAGWAALSSRPASAESHRPGSSGWGQPQVPRQGASAPGAISVGGGKE